MVSAWHKDMQTIFKDYGFKLGFRPELELGIPKGSIDCVWEAMEPIQQYFIAFEFETAKSGSQVVENLVKVLSIPSQRRPRFLIQIYKDELRNRDREYINEIAKTFPVTVKIIDNVGSEIDTASQRVIIEVFNWIGEYVKIPIQFLDKLEEIIPKEKVIKIFHYGETSSNNLKYLDNALHYSAENRLLWIKSVLTNKKNFEKDFASLIDYDIVILSDVSFKYIDLTSLEDFLEKEVKQKGKSIILTGGYGLTKKYNRLKQYLGGTICKYDGKSRIGDSGIKIDSGIGTGLSFGGINPFKATDNTDVKARWNIGDLPAIIIHRVGNGKVVTFTSDCSPAWGTASIETQVFKDMWKEILTSFYISKNIKLSIHRKAQE